jgi:hypothetical protein
LEQIVFADVEEKYVMLHMGRTDTDETLAKEGAESCGISVQGLSKFAKST